MIFQWLFLEFIIINLITRFRVRWFKLADVSFRTSNPYTYTSNFFAICGKYAMISLTKQSQIILNFLDRGKTGGGKLCYVKFEEISLLLSKNGMVKYFA